MPDDQTSAKLTGGAIIDALIAARIEIVPAVPDITTSAGLLWPLSRRPEIRLIRLCKEDEGVSICAALSNCGKRAALLMQQTGLYDSLNAVETTGVVHKQPVVMLVGLLGKEAGTPPRESKKHSVRVVEPVLRAMDVDYIVVEHDGDVPLMGPAIDRAFALSKPLVILFGRSVAP